MPYATTIAFVAALLSFGLAVTVFLREGPSVARFAFGVGMVALAVEAVFAGLCVRQVMPEWMIHWQRYQLLAMAFVPGTWLAFSLSYARGNYRESLKAWKFVLVGAVILPIFLVLAFWDWLITDIQPATAEHDELLNLGLPGMTLNLLLVIGAVLVLHNLERTFRASVGTMRWRIKYMVLGLCLYFAVRIYYGSQVLIYSAIDLSLLAVNAGALVVACLLVTRSVFRSGHFKVDVYPSQTLLSYSLTVILAGVYLLTVGVLAKLAAVWEGDIAFSVKAFLVFLAVAFLAVLLFSDRFQQHVRLFVSRHLKRPFHDYRRVWTQFTSRTTSLLNEGDLCRAVTQLVSETFEVLSVTVWLADSSKQRFVFGGSTSMLQGGPSDLAPAAQGWEEMVQGLSARPVPIDLETAAESWAAVFKDTHPDQFGKGGHRLCVPLTACGTELLGVMVLADRVSGVQFSLEDMELLKCIGDQVGANLQNLRLSERLLQAREMEAFQSMSAFFVHDLKNTASTLSLMLQNLPSRFEDPTFRQDALRAVSKSVSHINEMIRRLGQLRQKLELKLVATDLNEIVNRSAAAMGGIDALRLVKNLLSLPRVQADPDQIEKVVTNLLLNARDAVSGDGAGQIRVETSQRGRWAVLAVSDTGCGMSRDFLERCLFRPFQTTKKTGLGIGMFQSKMIIDAHQGRIEVESEQGKGSTFRLLLPMANTKP